MKLKVLLSLISASFFCCFAMESDSTSDFAKASSDRKATTDREKKEIFPVKGLPKDLQIKIFAESLKLNPQLSIIDNLKIIFPLTIPFAIKLKLNDFQKKIIYKKIGELIEQSYSKTDIDSNFFLEAQLASVYHQAKRVDVLQILLYAGANINKTDRTYGSAIFWPCTNNDFPILKFLIDNGADVNSKRFKETPLSTAAYCSSHELVQYLVDNGADVNLYPLTLFDAIKSRKDSFLKSEILIESGADLNAKWVETFLSAPNFEETSLQLAKRLGKQDIVQLIEDKMNSN